MMFCQVCSHIAKKFVKDYKSATENPISVTLAQLACVYIFMVVD